MSQTATEELHQIAREDPEAVFSLAAKARNIGGEAIEKRLLRLLREEYGAEYVDRRYRAGRYREGAAFGILNPDWDGEYVYVIEADPGTVKIGVSNNPKRRIKSLSTGNPSNLYLLTAVGLEDARRVERELHEELGSDNTSGEWFDVGIDRVGEVVRELQNKATSPKTNKGEPE